MVKTTVETVAGMVRVAVEVKAIRRGISRMNKGQYLYDAYTFSFLPPLFMYQEFISLEDNVAHE